MKSPSFFSPLFPENVAPSLLDPRQLERSPIPHREKIFPPLSLVMEIEKVFNPKEGIPSLMNRDPFSPPPPLRLNP